MKHIDLEFFGSYPELFLHQILQKVNAIPNWVISMRSVKTKFKKVRALKQIICLIIYSSGKQKYSDLTFNIFMKL